MIPPREPDAQLLQAGAGLDVIGLGLWRLSPRTVDAVLARHPRLDFSDGLGDFLAEAQRATRTDLLVRWLKFGLLEISVPMVAISAALRFGWRRRPAARAWIEVAMLGLSSVNLVLGAIVSVLPLAILPFDPEQSLGHYTSHVVYALTQLPLRLRRFLPRR